MSYIYDLIFRFVHTLLHIFRADLYKKGEFVITRLNKIKKTNCQVSQLLP